MKRKHNENWRSRKLDELGFVGRGKSRNRPRNAPELYNGPYPFVQTADIMASEFYITSYSKTYSEAGLAQSKMWEPNTLCMTIAGENTAETAILAFRACFPDSVVGFIADPEQADVRFVKYYLDHIRGQIRQVTRGATQDNLSLDKLLSFDIILPPVHQQTKIASVAAAYDELILNNQRRIAVLEKMAQAIYREWFVNFRFPGHEKIKLISSPLGKIPEGWKVEHLVDVCSLTMGQSPSSEFYNDNGDGLPFHQGVTNFGDRYPKHVTYTTVTKRIAEMGDVLFSVRAPVGRLNIADTRLVVGRGVSAIQHKQGKQVFLFHQLREKFKEEDTMGGGTIFKSVTKDDMCKITLISPISELINDFEKFVSGHFLLYHNLAKRNRLLRQTRDLLLPKLISGQLDVEKLKIETGESVVEATA